ncbi:YaiI/YqxD family protein [Bacillus sp. FJAT-45350]|uniref:YaiI/YqxD family protein n=1 Tax=Bacillus sp. FJAT-45350 TaxID=2011014 RepID=UPI000BB84D92|nr:YaiI/YqxD family protein [Bacillus sp. FJAT-45350]
MERIKQNIIVDADSCPVKEEIIIIAEEFKSEVFLISSYAHNVVDKRVAKSIIVDKDREAADLYIINHVQKGDVVVTQDHALASLLLPRGANVISPRGMIYDEDNISNLLHLRHLSQKQRRAGNKTKGPKKFTETDRINFSNVLRKILSQKEGL